MEQARRRRTSLAIGTVVALAVCMMGHCLLADETNYQKYVIGERAMGMAGAFTAAVDDPMACYYNPGAMVFSSSSMISASKSLYSYDYRFIKDGFYPRSDQAADVSDTPDAKTLEHENDLTLPSTLALTFRFGPRLYEDGPRRHAVGISVVVPYQDSYTLTAKWAGEGALVDRETYTLSESHKDIWTGVSYGLRIAEQWGLGLSAYLSEATYKRRLDINWYRDLGGAEECSLYSCGYLDFMESSLEITVVSLIFKLGALWTPHQNWRLGLTVTSPSIVLGDLWLMETSGALDQTRGIASVENTGDDYIEFYSDKYGLEVTRKRPLSLRAGAAFMGLSDFVIDLDVALHLPIDYRRIEGDPVTDRFEQYQAELEQNGSVDGPIPSPEWYDKGIVKGIKRRPVVNTNLGGEWRIGESFTLRGGVFTDFSSAPKLTDSDHPQLTRIHRFGGALSVGYQNYGYDITIGATGSFGRGEASVFHPLGSSGGEYVRPWRPAEYEERAIYIFIAGMQKAVAKTAKTLWNKAWEKD